MAHHHAYPTPSALNATPKTPSSMSEWRMMQMQLQQQDDLHFSLTLPSVSALSANTVTSTTPSSSSQTRSPVSHYGLTSVSMAPVSATTASSCSCGGCTSGEAAIPMTIAPSLGNQTPGPELPAVHKHLHSFSNTLSPSAPVYQQQNNHSFPSTPATGPPQQHQTQINQIYNLYSSSTTSDFFLQETNNKAPGSTATVNSEYAPSSADPSEFENNMYGPSSAGSEAHLTQFLPHSFGRSTSPSQQQPGAKYCKNCPVHSRRPSMAVGPGPGGQGSGSGRPSSPGGDEMEHSVSTSSMAGSSNSTRTSSPGLFRSLSSKLAATTIRKMSISQKSLFSASKEDLAWSAQGSSQDNNSKENLLTEAGQGTVSGVGPSCGCTCQGFSTFNGGGSTGTGEGGSLSKPLSKTQSRLGNLRRKDKDKNKHRKSREMDYNYSSRFVREEFAQYNYERQIEDFQRAARVFKEQKALTTAAAAAAIAAEARAAVAEASLSAAATAAAAAEEEEEAAARAKKVMGEKSFSFSSASLAITPIQEEESPSTDTSGEKSLATAHHQTTAHSSESAKIRKKSLGRPGLLRSMSRPHRRVGSSSGSVVSNKGSKKSQTSNISSISMSGSRGSSIPHGKSDSSYLELGQVGMGMGMDLKLPGLGLPFGSGFGLDNILESDPYNDTREPTKIEVRSVETATNGAFEEIPLRDMPSSSSPGVPSPLSHLLKDIPMPKKPEDALGFKGHTSNVSQDTRHGYTNPLRGRSVHSACSVDTVSQQIAARHHQHSRLHNLSNVASLSSQVQGAPPCHVPTANGGSAGCSGGGTCSSTGNNIVVENSPIQVVRATVGTVDDTSLPCFTFRMWVLSTMFVIMGAAISEYNFFRSNSAYFSIYFVQLASYFCGKAMARWLPTRVFEIQLVGLSWLVSKWRFFFGSDDTTEVGVNSGHSDNSTLSGNGRHVRGGSSGAVGGGAIQGMSRSGLSRSNIASTKVAQSSNMTLGRGRKEYSWSFTLNPGKFNMKEHMLIGIAAAAGCAPAYASNVIAIQSLVFSSPLGSLTGAGLVLSSQCIGFSMAWLLFDYVIKPSVMIWPATLVNVSLYNTLHEHKVLTRWFTRMQLFWYAFFAIFLYQWLPKMFMPVLTSMALLCWIKPSSNVLRKLGSGYVGLGMGCISLDWSIISGVGPLYTPWWAQANFFVGLIAMLWIVTPIVYFSNYWSAMSYPIVSSNLYDNQAELYDISKIVNKDLSFNLTMYEAYSPVIMTPYFAITYGTSFMAVVASFIHVALYYGSDIWLIAKTQCGRKLRRIRTSRIGRTLSRLSQGKTSSSTSPKELGLDSQDHTGFGATSAPNMNLTMSGVGELSALDAYTLDGSRRNSESVSFRADLEGGKAAVGHGAEERPSFQQSSHYRQLSQQYDGFQATCEDDREQIPTEMFGSEDIHTRLMRAYPEIPGWWFAVMFVVCFIAAVIVCKTSEIQLPVYALIIALLLAAVFALPMAIIQALSSSQIGLNVLSEVVCGYLLPGNQLGNSVFKCYSYMALYQCLNLTQGFKLGHYMKVPPRKIFIMVLYGTFLGAAVNLEVLHWILTYNRQALFDADLRSGWSFRNLDLFFSASLLWGAISPKHLFGDGSIYHFLPYCFLIGLFLPVPFYLMYRHYPPYGSVCKGTSSLPFLPKCQCPASHQQTSSSSTRDGVQGDASLYPKPHHTNRPSLDQETKLASVKIDRHFCWPFRTHASSAHKHDQLNDKSVTSNEEHSSASISSQAPPPPPSHLYYGNPDSAWEGRLRRVPWHLFNMPLVCVGASFVPQAPASFVGSAGIVAFIFAFLVLRYRHEWWRRYTFVLAAALDAGTQICNMAVFVVFSLILKGAVEFPSWFGNDEQNPEKCGVGDGYN
ncbi:hypothetical protein BG006_001724 [Podila minutissima]|uniref:Oligopeptide transporter n=1 Tax=Podila minutissima TaxID=64525 RepID=A0A9P5SR46_9FUNG|nr:hypothetical protein BG006_001724 [Podila minutissima]